MDGLADLVYQVSLVLALWATGVGLGLSSDVSGFLAPLRRTTLLIRILALDVVVLPLVVKGLTLLVDVPTDGSVGLILVGIASAGPLGIIATRIAGGDARAAASFVVVLEAVNALAIPLWVIVLLPDGVDVSPRRVLATLLGLIIAPLAVGAVVRRSRGRAVERWARPLAIASNALVLVIVVAVLLGNGSDVMDSLTNGVALVALLSVIVALGSGWLAGGPTRDTRIAVALVTGVRANGLALAIAQASFPDRAAVQTAVVAFGVLSALLPLAMAYALTTLPSRPGHGYGAFLRRPAR